MKKSAIIILSDGFEEIEAITPIDLLRRANIEIDILGLNGLEITGSHAIKIHAEKLLENSSDLPDAIILPGGPGHKNLFNSTLVISMVKEMFRAKKLCAAICAAPSVFGKAGILAGKAATCFPGFEKTLSGASFIDMPVVVDDNIITSRGAGTAVPFSLEIIKYLIDSETAEKIASTIIYRT